MYKPLPLNFLLGCSENSLANFELARLDEMAQLRKELQLVLDRLLDQMSQAAIAGWFRQSERNAIKYAIENEEPPLQMAARMIRDGQRSDEELADELIPLPSLPPGAAHLAAAMRYQERNIAQGKCSLCPKPLARHSVRYCDKHLTAQRLRMTPSKGRPGSVEWLYGETEETSHGRQPGSITALAMAREQKTREILAEMGVSPESAAVSLKAAKEALLKCMPASEPDACTADALFQAATVPSPTTGHHAPRDLFAAGAIQRITRRGKGTPFLYFKRYTASEETCSPTPRRVAREEARAGMKVSGALWAFSPSSCPRCDGPLRERGQNRKWRRFFECGQCWATFEPAIETRFQPCGHNPRAKFLRHTITLQPGRTPAAIRRSK
jgi:hypothetical protein